MHIQHVFQSLILYATATSAFNIYYPSPSSGVAKTPVANGHTDNSGNEWRPVKVPRDANPFRPGLEGMDVKKLELKPVKPMEMKLKRIPQPESDLHPEIRSVLEANSVSRKFRKRGIPGPEINEALAVRNAVSSLEKRGLVKRQRNNFDILRSKEPSTPDSMAVHQDGFDAAYFSEIQFGSTKKKFLLIIDTGSSDTWVPSENCTTQACTLHNTFGRKDSTTMVDQGRTFEIQYGSGNVAGIVVKDNVSFAGFNINIEFGLSTMVSQEFVYFPIDGIMGLGFRKASASRAKTIMDVLVDEKHIGQKLFSVAISRASDKLNDGVIHFGGVDDTYKKGDINWAPSLPNYGLWELNLDDAALDGKKYGFRGRTAIIDTGTTLILLPPTDAMTLHEVIDDAMTNGETFAVPCATTKNLEFTFNGVAYKIPPKDWIGEKLGQGTSLCVSKIMGRSIIDDNTWLVGDVFLKNVYAIFDMDNSRVGFAERSSPNGGSNNNNNNNNNNNGNNNNGNNNGSNGDQDNTNGNDDSGAGRTVTLSTGLFVAGLLFGLLRF